MEKIGTRKGFQYKVKSPSKAVKVTYEELETSKSLVVPAPTVPAPTDDSIVPKTRSSLKRTRIHDNTAHEDDGNKSRQSRKSSRSKIQSPATANITTASPKSRKNLKDIFIKSIEDELIPDAVDEEKVASQSPPVKIDLRVDDANEGHASAAFPKKEKSYYPRIVVDARKLALSAQSSQQNVLGEGEHKAIFMRILHDVCSAEAEGLRTHFSTLLEETEEQQTNHSLILKSLLAVLSNIQEVAQEYCPESATFAAEITSSQKTQIIELQKTLSVLQGRSDTLSAHLQSIHNGDDSQSLSGGALPSVLPDVPDSMDEEDPVVVIARSSLNPYSIAVATEVDTLLKRIGTSASSLSHQTEVVREELSRSRRLQGVVYDTFNQIRFKPQDLAMREPPNNPKELIKGLQSMR